MAKLAKYQPGGISSKPLFGRLPDDGTNAVLAEIASTSAALSDKIGAMADKAAKKEGHQAGMIAGLDREFRPTRDNTIRGEAYDRAGISARLDLTEAEVRSELSDISLRHANDPDGLAASIEKYATEKIDEVDGDGQFPELRVSLTSLITRTQTTLIRDALRGKMANEKNSRQAMFETGLRSSINSIGRASYVNGLGEEADEVINGELNSIRRSLQGAVDNESITPVAAGRMFAEVQENSAVQRVLGTFERLENVAGKQQFLDELNNDYASGKGVMSLFSPEKFATVRRALEVSISRDVSASKAYGNALDRDWDSMEAGANAGLPPSPEDVSKQFALAEATGSETIIARANNAVRNIDYGRDLQTRTPIELEQMRQGIIGKSQISGATETDRERLKSIGKVQSAMAKQLKNDPYAWGLRAGVLPDAPTITFAGDDATVAALQNRSLARQTMESKYGKVPFFTRGETEALTYLANKGGQQMLDVSKAIVSALGDDAHLVLGEISNEAPILANLAGIAMATGDDRLAAEASAALALRQDENYKPIKIKKAQQQQSSIEFLGNAYSSNPLTRSMVMQTAQLLFERRIAELGLDPDFDDEPRAREVWENALDEATGARQIAGIKYGGIDDVNGTKIITPSYMAEGELQQRLWSIDAQDIEKLVAIDSANNLMIKPGQIQDAHLVAIGDGRYRVSLNDPASAKPDYVMNKKNGFWILDAQQLKTVQGQRNIGMVNMPGGLNITPEDVQKMIDTGEFPEG